jgi:hypothetical protein
MWHPCACTLSLVYVLWLQRTCVLNREMRSVFGELRTQILRVSLTSPAHLPPFFDGTMAGRSATSSRLGPSPAPARANPSLPKVIGRDNRGRVLCLADLRGRISNLNELAQEAGADAILHTGDFGFFGKQTWRVFAYSETCLTLPRCFREFQPRQDQRPVCCLGLESPVPYCSPLSAFLLFSRVFESLPYICLTQFVSDFSELSDILFSIPPLSPLINANNLLPMATRYPRFVPQLLHPRYRSSPNFQNFSLGRLNFQYPYTPSGVLVRM